MIAALRYEWVRIRTIRSTYWLSVIALVFGIGLAFLASMGTSFAFDSPHPPSGSDVENLGPAIATQFAVFGAPYFVAYILAMIAVFAWGHEYRHGMIRATLTALRSRTGSWIAKFVVLSGWCLVVVLLTCLGSALAGWLWLRDDGVSFASADMGKTIARALVYTLVFICIAAAFTSLIRNQTAALVLLFLWPLAIENVIALVMQVVPGLRDHSDVTRFLPFTAGDRILSQPPGSSSSLFGEQLSSIGGLVIFGGLTVVLMAASLLLFRRRDA